MPVPRNVRLLGWFNFWADFRPYAPIAILYFAQVSGSYALGMSVYSVATLSQSFFEVPTGLFSDLIGRKRTVVCGAVASTLSLVMYSIGGTYLALLIGAAFEGLARAFYSGNNEALLYDTLAESGQSDAYQEHLGKTSARDQFALAISAVIGSLFAVISFQIVLWISVIPMGLALLVSLFFTEPRAHSHPTQAYVHIRVAIQKIVQNPRLRGLSAASTLSFAIGESAWLFRSAFVEKLWPVWGLGLAQLIANAGAAVGFYFAGRIIRRFGEFRLLVGGMSISEGINLFALAVPTVLSPVLMALNSIFFGVNSVATGGLIQREFSDEQRATMGSLNSFAGSIVFAVFSFLLGALADRIGPILALVVATLLSIVPMALYWRVLREQKPLLATGAYPRGEAGTRAKRPA
jgi:MFS family permease